MYRTCIIEQYGKDGKEDAICGLVINMKASTRVIYDAFAELYLGLV